MSASRKSESANCSICRGIRGHGARVTFYSGAVEAWLVDALKSTGYEGQLDTVFARGSMVTGAAMLMGTMGGGLLGSIDLAVPYLVRSGILVGVFLVAFFTMRDLGLSPPYAAFIGYSRRNGESVAERRASRPAGGAVPCAC